MYANGFLARQPFNVCSSYKYNIIKEIYLYLASSLQSGNIFEPRSITRSIFDRSNLNGLLESQSVEREFEISRRSVNKNCKPQGLMRSMARKGPMMMMSN